MRQYEIWWAKIPGPAGERPVLLLSRTSAFSHLNKFIAVEITQTVRLIPVEVPLGSEEGLPQMCVANCDNLRNISKAWLVRRMGSLHANRQQELKRALGHALGWEELIEVQA